MKYKLITVLCVLVIFSFKSFGFSGFPHNNENKDVCVKSICLIEFEVDAPLDKEKVEKMLSWANSLFKSDDQATPVHFLGMSDSKLKFYVSVFGGNHNSYGLNLAARAFENTDAVTGFRVVLRNDIKLNQLLQFDCEEKNEALCPPKAQHYELEPG